MTFRLWEVGRVAVVNADVLGPLQINEKSVPCKEINIFSMENRIFRLFLPLERFFDA